MTSSLFICTWWRHPMEIFSALLALCVGPPVNSPHKGQWREALMFPLVCAWINVWVYNREAGDLRRHRAHYDVIAMNRCTVQRSFIKIQYNAILHKLDIMRNTIQPVVLHRARQLYPEIQSQTNNVKIQIQIRLFDIILQNQTWVDTYILYFDTSFLSMIKFHSCWYGDPY